MSPMRTTHFRFWAIFVAATLMGVLLLSACATAPAPTPTSAPKPIQPAEAPKAATATSVKAPEPTKPAAKAPEPAKPAAQGPQPAPAAGGQLALIKFADASSFVFAPLYWAVEKGYFKEAGVEVKFDTMVGGDTDAVPFLATGQLDMAGGGLSSAHFNAYARGLDVKIVSPLGILRNGSAPLVIRTDLYEQAANKTAAILKGKKVAINNRGGNVEWLVTRALQKASLGIKDVEIVTMSFADMPLALANKQIDAGLIAEPGATRAVQMGAGKVLDGDIATGKSTTILLASPKLIAERPQALRDFMTAFMRSVRDLQDLNQLYTDDKMAVWMKYTKMPAEVIKGMVPFAWDPELNVQHDVIDDQQAMYRSHGHLNYQELIASQKVVDDTFAKYAREKLGPWKRP